MPQWDYSGNGVYFITLVTKNRECNLGQIITEMDDLCVANDLHGTNGTNGMNGTNGLHGTNGTNGMNGLHGTNGMNGLHGTNGMNGLHGTNGTHDSHVETHGRASLHGNGHNGNGHNDNGHNGNGHNNNNNVRHYQIKLSDFGEIINREWLKSFEIRDELFLDEYIIMPNHLHAVVIINHESDGMHGTNDSYDSHDLHVETHGRASLQSPQFPIRKPKSLSSFIAGFKSAVNTKIDDFIDAHDLDMPKYNKNNPFFQPNYHDRIIRNQQEYQRIKEYIIQNPIKWDEDRFNEKLYN